MSNWIEQLYNYDNNKIDNDIAFDIAYDLSKYISNNNLNYKSLAEIVGFDEKVIKEILIGNEIPNVEYLKNIEIQTGHIIFDYLHQTNYLQNFNSKSNDTNDNQIDIESQTLDASNIIYNTLSNQVNFIQEPLVKFQDKSKEDLNNQN